MKYIIILLLLFVIELAYFKIAEKFNITDTPNERSSHSSVILRGGGIIFLVGIWLYVAFFGFSYPYFFTGLTMVGLISLADDIRPVSVKLRLVVQFISMLLMFYQFGILLPQNWWILIISIIVCVGIINAYNFMDGINGITGCYSIAVILPLLYLNQTYGFISQSWLYVVGLSLVVFIFFNCRKHARCFAGDVGSISIAFILLFVMGKLIIQTQNFAYIGFLAIYGVDTVLTICHRIKLREKINEAHRKHAYQIMANELKVPQVYVSLIYTLMQLAISFGMIFIPINNYIYLAIVVALLIVAYVIFIKRNYHLHEEYLKTCSNDN